jgi:CheY-like chemotaxis protein
MPDGSALDLLRRLGRSPDQPAISLGVEGVASDVTAARLAGFDRHLTRPVDGSSVARELHSLFEAVALRQRAALSN